MVSGRHLRVEHLLATLIFVVGVVTSSSSGEKEASR